MAVSSVTTMVVSVIAALSSFVGAVILTTGGVVSMIYDCEFIPEARIILSSAVTVIVHESDILFISHVTGDIYGSTVHHPVPVQTHRLTHVVPGASCMFVIAFQVGAEIVTVESVIVVLLRVVGALMVIIGGNLMVVLELFPAVSYTVTTIV